MKTKMNTYNYENQIERRALQRSIRKMSETASLKELRIIQGFMLGVLR